MMIVVLRTCIRNQNLYNANQYTVKFDAMHVSAFDPIKPSGNYMPQLS
jgi:hypothetical protein